MTLSGTGISPNVSRNYSGRILVYERDRCQVENGLYAFELSLTLEPVLCFPPHARHHAGHRQGPECFGGDRIESSAQPGADQRGYAQASAAPRSAIELSNELGGAQPGHAPHLHDWGTAAGIRAPILCRDRAGCGADRPAARLSHCDLILRGRSRTGGQRDRLSVSPPSRRINHRFLATAAPSGCLQADASPEYSFYSD